MSDQPPVLVGIDAGGSSTDVQAESADGQVFFQSSAGGANATSTPQTLLEQNLLEALDGCPHPFRVGGCFAGVSTPGARTLIHQILSKRFDDTELRLAPDYVGALLASDDSDVCVVAGTGSVCTSLVEGRVAASGGRGYLIGDHGSGFRLGQALLNHAMEESDQDLSPRVLDALLEVFGGTHRREIVRTIHEYDAPAELIAQFAKPLGVSADNGEDWAVRLVRREMSLLAHTVGRHVARHLRERSSLRIHVAGGVWASATTLSAFTAALEQQLPDRALLVTAAHRPPVHGALRLAAMRRDEFDALALSTIRVGGAPSKSAQTGRV